MSIGFAKKLKTKISMKTSIKIILGAFLVLCPLLKGETIKSLLIQSIGSSAEEGWEYSSSGGYVFEAEMDMVGDSEPEKIVWFSIDDHGSIHIFDSSSGQKYLGKLDRHLLDSPMIKENGKSTIFSISDSGNHPSEGEEAFTKKVLSTVISTEGVEILERVAGVGPGNIEDKQFNEILNGSIKLEDSTNFKPPVRFTSLRSYLNGEDNWAEFKQAEWVEMDSYLIHQDDIAVVRKIKSSSDENEIKALLGDFTQAKALKLLGNIEPRKEKVNSIDQNVRDESAANKRALSSKLEPHQEEAAPEKKSSFPWIISGVLLSGILALLLKTYKDKSAS